MILCYLLWSMLLLRTIRIYEDASAGPKYTNTRFRWFLHQSKNHILYLFPSRALRFISASSPLFIWTVGEGSWFYHSEVSNREKEVPMIVGLPWGNSEDARWWIPKENSILLWQEVIYCQEWTTSAVDFFFQSFLLVTTMVGMTACLIFPSGTIFKMWSPHACSFLRI